MGGCLKILQHPLHHANVIAKGANGPIAQRSKQPANAPSLVAMVYCELPNLSGFEVPHCFWTLANCAYAALLCHQRIKVGLRLCRCASGPVAPLLVAGVCDLPLVFKFPVIFWISPLFCSKCSVLAYPAPRSAAMFVVRCLGKILQGLCLFAFRAGLYQFHSPNPLSGDSSLEKCSSAASYIASSCAFPHSGVPYFGLSGVGR